MSSKRYDPIDGEVVGATDAAVQVDLGDGNPPVWIPRSVCEGGDTLEVGDDDLRVERWFAEKEGL